MAMAWTAALFPVPGGPTRSSFWRGRRGVRGEHAAVGVLRNQVQQGGLDARVEHQVLELEPRFRQRQQRHLVAAGRHRLQRQHRGPTRSPRITQRRLKLTGQQGVVLPPLVVDQMLRAGQEGQGVVGSPRREEPAQQVASGHEPSLVVPTPTSVPFEADSLADAQARRPSHGEGPVARRATRTPRTPAHPVLRTPRGDASDVPESLDAAGWDC